MEGLSKFVKSFYYASQGLKTGWQQRNFKVHIFISFSVVLLSVFFLISFVEWLVVILLLGFVLSAELFNTAIEEICNLLNKKLKLDYYDTWNPRNLGAAAVFIAAITSAIIGTIIFLPKIIALLPPTTIQ